MEPNGEIMLFGIVKDGCDGKDNFYGYTIIMLRYKPYKKAYRQKLPLLLNRFFVIFTFEGANNCLMGKWEWL